MRSFLLVLLASLAIAAPAQAATDAFEYTGGAQDWVVPDGVTRTATVDLYGGAGGFSNLVGNVYGVGGLGGRATAPVSFDPGTARVYVGGAGGGEPGPGTPGGGGFNGGGNSVLGGGGGGATDLRISGSALTDRALVAGGGGGAGNCQDIAVVPFSKAFGGAGGGLTGTAGGTACSPDSGGPGDQSQGGAKNRGGVDGTFGIGGAGDSSGGGGGGGGWYGGGGSGLAGAGGGSGHGPAGTTFETGVRSGAGRATITYVELSISGGPVGTTTEVRPEFSFSAEAGATVQCSIDQGTEALVPCVGAAGTHRPAANLPAGDYTFRVRAADGAGNSSVATRAFTVAQTPSSAGDPSAPVAPSGTGRDRIAPVITQARFSAGTFAVNGKAGAARTIGSKVRFRLSEPATVVFVTEQRVRGRWRKVRIFGKRLGAGQNTVDYSGRIKPRGRTRKLRPGRYRIRMRPSDRAGNRGVVTTLGFGIVK